MATTLSTIMPGATKSFTLTGKATGLSTSDTVTLRIKDKCTDADSAVLLTKTATNITANGNEYTASFTLTPADTAALELGTSQCSSATKFYDITWECVSGQKYVFPVETGIGKVVVTYRVSDV